MKGARESLHKARRIVVKVGSRVLAEDARLPERMAQGIRELPPKGRFVIVTSGAIALGCDRLGYATRPQEIGRLQAAAAAGQGLLMRRYEEALSAVGLVSAQVLLTHGDLADRDRLNNAREALQALLDAGAVPVINENDTVATEEIRFGDNDQLAAMVTPLVGAELLVLLTDVEGVIDARGRRLSFVEDPKDLPALTPATGSSAFGSGGMPSKLDAARKACHAGASVVIAPARAEGVLGRILGGEDIGTLVGSVGSRLQARKHWIAYSLRPKGVLVLDDGAVEALKRGRSSLLPVGVIGVRGQFNAGDAVRLVSSQNLEVGRGLTRVGTVDVARAAGKQKADVQKDLLLDDGVIVHKDDLVLI